MAMDTRDYERRDALRQGTDLRGYTIRDVLGQGGFGIVYRACHNELGNLVAIKEYLPIELAVRDGGSVHPRNAEHRPAYEDGLRRFGEEARRLVEFRKHPNIVSCRDFFRANGTAYLVMDYEDGMPLSELLRARELSGRPFDEADLLAVMVPLLDGLREIHAAGVLHRDIKPSNILISREDERPILIDFGSAKQVVAGYSKSLAPYTEGYAALEQVGDGDLGTWTDMYAVGAAMWRIVAGGNPPWEPPNPVKVESRAGAALRGAADPLTPARELGAGRFSAGVLEAIDKCLELKETDRVQDSSALLSLLRRKKPLSSELPQTGGHSRKSPPQRVGENARKRRRFPAAAWVLLCVSVIAVLTLRDDQSATQPVETKSERVPEPGPLAPAVKAADFTVLPDPAGAKVVLLDSREKYRPGMKLPFGSYRVEVSASGYKARRVRIEHSRAGAYRVSLERLAASFTVVTEPTGAKIVLLGSREPYRPGMALPPGEYRVEVSAAGYEKAAVSIAHGGEPTRKRIALERIAEPDPVVPAVNTASFTLLTEPVDAKVVLLGSREPYRPGIELRLGKYRVEVSAPGYRTRRVRIEHSGAVPYRVMLERAAASFTVVTEPLGAKVVLLGSREPYRPGMALPPGTYRVEVSVPRYETATVSIKHGEKPTRRVVRLKSSRSRRDYFTRGSHKDEVVRLQGTPSRINKGWQKETWWYGSSWVEIDSQTGRVLEWSNSGKLKVKLLPGSNTTSVSYFTRGSHKDDVVRLQGTPSSINKGWQKETWWYGSSWVEIDSQTDRVLEWSNSGKLKVKLLPGSNTTNASYFTQGSHKDDVVRLQGTPSSINKGWQKETWWYGSSWVEIDSRTGRVLEWSNSGNLRVGM